MQTDICNEKLDEERYTSNDNNLEPPEYQNQGASTSKKNAQNINQYTDFKNEHHEPKKKCASGRDFLKKYCQCGTNHRIIMCKYCFKAFPTSDLLRIHEKTCEKRTGCDHCEKTKEPKKKTRPLLPMPCCPYYLVMVLALFILIVGIIFLIIGLILLLQSNLFLYTVFFSDTSSENFNKTFGSNVKMDDVLITLSQYTKPVGINFSSIGILLILYGIVVIMTVQLRIIHLYLCVAILFIIILAIVALLIFYSLDTSTRVLAPLKEYIENDLLTKYVGLMTNNSESILINIVQIKMKCCGLNSSEDFSNSPNFIKFIVQDNHIVQIPIPLSCCYYENDYSITKKLFDDCIYNGESRKNDGCWIPLKSSIEFYFMIWVIFMTGIIIYLIVIIVTLLMHISCVCMNL